MSMRRIAYLVRLVYADTYPPLACYAAHWVNGAENLHRRAR